MICSGSVGNISYKPTYDYLLTLICSVEGEGDGEKLKWDARWRAGEKGKWRGREKKGKGDRGESERAEKEIDLSY